MRRTKKALLIVSNDAFGRQMARWALTLKHQGEWEPIIYISANYMERHMVACREEGITVLLPELGTPHSAGEEKQPALSRLLGCKRWKTVLNHVPGYDRLMNLLQRFFLVRVFSTMNNLTKHLYLIRHIIKHNQISVVLISESSPAYNAPIYIGAAHQEHIPVVTSPVEKTDSHDFADCYLYEKSMSLNRPINWLIGKFFPRWVFSHKGYQIVRVVPELLLALEWMRLAPPYPWRLLGNQEDMVAVDSQSTFDFFTLQGVVPERMTVIGSPEQDIMSRGLRDREKRRNNLYTRLGLPTNRPMLLSPLVQEHYISGRPECDFQDYKKMVEFWVRSLGATDGYNVIISLHPGHTYLQDSNAWDYIEQWGVKICTDDLATLVPLCDIYVGASSSTTQWAIACGKPVINYDVYRYGLAIFRDLPGVLDIQEQHDFLYTLKRLTSEPAYYAEIAAAQARYAEQWGCLDGKAGKRLAILFDQLVANSQMV